MWTFHEWHATGFGEPVVLRRDFSWIFANYFGGDFQPPDIQAWTRFFFDKGKDDTKGEYFRLDLNFLQGLNLDRNTVAKSAVCHEISHENRGLWAKEFVARI